jgi:hypothetical protein
MKKKNIALILFFGIFISEVFSQQINLNGTWKFGVNRKYNKEVEVPGIVTDPTQFNENKIWYKREVRLPEGDWSYGTLQLSGARFAPQVYIDGVLASKKNGGMAPTFHFLKSNHIKPGKSIIIEIALSPLNNLPESDASYIPEADHWRSNISSYLWDDVVLKFHNGIKISRLIPFYDIETKVIKLKYELDKIDYKRTEPFSMEIEIMDPHGKKLIGKEFVKTGLKGELDFYYGDNIQLWTPLIPNLYNLTLSVKDRKITLDKEQITIGIKQFEEKEKQFYLNGNPYKVRAGTIVWHRWSRNTENMDILYDTTWFINNIIKPLKDRGANTLRFHLGNPPERFLDLCDKFGLLVQYEWIFFHGMPASEKSLVEQWRSWLDLSMKHPSVALIHPYNETEGEQLIIAWDALNELLPEYPELVVEDRDVLHIHKYWWSLFENLGLYYDTYDEFPKAIMVDEFGGNYLDGEYNMGDYPTTSEAYLRFLGRGHTAIQRMHHHTISNSRVAEYWRRIGAAGFSPFCILGSKEDGSHWYVGDIHEGNLKPVWNALTAAWSPRSVSIEIWNRNFIPGQTITFPIHFFNDTDMEDNLSVEIRIEDPDGNVLYHHPIQKNIGAFSQVVDTFSLTLPGVEGKYLIKAELLNPPGYIKYPVISAWQVNIFSLKMDEKLQQIKIAISSYEDELYKFSADNNLSTTDFNDPKADVILTSAKTWDKITQLDKATLEIIENAINAGISVIMLDVGDVFLGQGYVDQKSKLTFLQGRYSVMNQITNKYEIIKGIELTFKQIAEPESHIHPDRNNDMLWENIPPGHTWLWNGLRGGIIVPATNMEISGLNRNAYLSKWAAKGAEENKIKSESYFAYDLQGFYRFSDLSKDEKLQSELRREVKFLVEDAPALKGSINPNAPMEIIDLTEGYKSSEKGQAKNIQPLVNCGRNLTQTPVILIDFGEGKGQLILSQLVTSGRLAGSPEAGGIYDIRYDAVACQFLINMIKTALRPPSPH